MLQDNVSCGPMTSKSPTEENAGSNMPFLSNSSNPTLSHVSREYEYRKNQFLSFSKFSWVLGIPLHSTISISIAHLYQEPGI